MLTSRIHTNISKQRNSTLNRIMALIEANPILILSTSIDNRPHSRPIGSFRLVKKHIYFTMNNNKPLFTQLKSNPYICICACGADFSWLRIYAKATICDDLDVKTFFVEQRLTRFSDVNDPLFTVIKLHKIYAESHKMGKVEIFRI